MDRCIEDEALNRIEAQSEILEIIRMLTIREKQVLALMDEGMGVGEIAECMKLSIRTIYYSKQQIRIKAETRKESVSKTLVGDGKDGRSEIRSDNNDASSDKPSTGVCGCKIT